jgi:hypothetical protein
MQSADSPKPVAAMLAILRLSSAPVLLLTHLARSSTWPLWELACSAK